MPAELWQFEVTPIRHPAGFFLLRFRRRNHEPWEFFHGKDYGDFDYSGRLSPELFWRWRDLVVMLGFHLPHGINSKALLAILSLSGFPNIDLCGGEAIYPPWQYTSDHTWWWHNRFQAKTANELFHIFLRQKTRCEKKSTLPDRAAYARMCIISFEDQLRKLNEFYGYVEIPDKIAHAVWELRALGNAYLPQSKADRKKLAKSPGVDDHEKEIKKIRKAKKDVDQVKLLV